MYRGCIWSNTGTTQTPKPFIPASKVVTLPTHFLFLIIWPEKRKIKKRYSHAHLRYALPAFSKQPAVGALMWCASFRGVWTTGMTRNARFDLGITPCCIRIALLRDMKPKDQKHEHKRYTLSLCGHRPGMWRTRARSPVSSHAAQQNFVQHQRAVKPLTWGSQ